MVGRVTNAITGRPIAGATILGNTGHNTYSTKCNAAGWYRLNVPPGQLELDVTATGHSQVTAMPSVPVAAKMATVIDVQMRKDHIGHGDVVFSIPFNHDNVSGLAVNSHWVYYTASDSRSTSLYRCMPNGNTISRIAALPIQGGIAWANEVLFGIETWPGRLYKITPEEAQSTQIQSLGMDWSRSLAFDGTRLWFLETNSIDNRYGVHALDVRTGERLAHFPTNDPGIDGIGAGNNLLWISSTTGLVYEINPTIAIKEGSLEAGILRRFPGHYGQLSYFNGKLSAVDNETKRICMIHLQKSQQ